MQQWTVVDPGSVAAEPTPASTGATRITLNPIKDATLYESADGSVSNGAGGHLFSGTNNGGNIRRIVIAFDIAGNIPAGATISSVSLRLNMSRTAAGSAKTFSLHKLLADWGQGSSDAEQNEGKGIASTPGDATWVHRFFNTETWEEAGGDFSEAASASTEVSDLGPYIWASPEMMADVQSWVDNPDSNFGWVLIGDESANQTTKRFNSMENRIQPSRPVLTIELQQ